MIQTPSLCHRRLTKAAWGCLLVAWGCGIDPTQSSGAIASGGAGGATGAAVVAGAAGWSEGGAAAGDAGAAATVGWSCGVAAGACTCVRVDAPLASAVCAPSGCCFIDPSGDCTCRLGEPAPACDDLMRAFGATERVPECPQN